MGQFKKIPVFSRLCSFLNRRPRDGGKKPVSPDAEYVFLGEEVNFQKAKKKYHSLVGELVRALTMFCRDESDENYKCGSFSRDDSERILMEYPSLACILKVFEGEKGGFYDSFGRRLTIETLFVLQAVRNFWYAYDKCEPRVKVDWENQEKILYSFDRLKNMFGPEFLKVCEEYGEQWLGGLYELNELEEAVCDVDFFKEIRFTPPTWVNFPREIHFVRPCWSSHYKMVRRPGWYMLSREVFYQYLKSLGAFPYRIPSDLNL